MNTYTWTITALNCNPQEDGKTNVVTSANWTLSATDGTYNASTSGTSNFTFDPSKSFINFADLTQDEVAGWVEAGIQNDILVSMKAGLDKQISDQANPPIITPPLPWMPTQEIEPTIIAAPPA